MADYNGIATRPGHGPEHDTTLERAIYWMDRWLPPLPPAVREAMAHDLSDLLDSCEADGFHACVGIMVSDGYAEPATHCIAVRTEWLRAKWPNQPGREES